MRTSAGASTPSRTWFPFTSSTRTVTESPTRMISPSFRVRTSIAHGVSAGCGRRLRRRARSRDSAVAPALRRAPGSTSGDELAQHVAQELARHLGGGHGVGAVGDHGAQLDPPVGAGGRELVEPFAQL